MIENNNYGALNNEEELPKLQNSNSASRQNSRQRFDIVEANYDSGNGLRSGSCCGRNSDTDGFKIIVISMFVFAVGVTVALIITIASEPAPIVHQADVVTSDNPACSKVGQGVLQEGGNAIDAAVATSLCLAMAEPHITGIGGGGLMLIHSHRKNTSTVIDFRESAPENARNDRFIQNPRSAQFGRNSIGVPGFIKGLEYAHKNYGSGHFGLKCCSWKDLVWKALNVIKKGIVINENFKSATMTKISQIEKESTDARLLREMIDTKQPTKYFNEVNIFKKLINTMEIIAMKGSASLYENGQIGQNLVKELPGILTAEDLVNYEVKEYKPNTTMIGSYEVMVSPAPSSGPELLAFLNTLEYLKQEAKLDFGKMSAKYLHNMTNVLENLNKLQLKLGDNPNPDVNNIVKFMLDKKNSPGWVSNIQGKSLDDADPNYALSDPVAANVGIMDKKDNYVSVVTSLNTWFGSKIMTKDGILLNNAMANFAIPTESGSLTTANQLAEGRRPLTSNVVALTMDTKTICGSRIVTGGASASSVGQVLAFPLLMDSDLRSSVDSARIDIQNSTVFVENADPVDGFSPKVLMDFRNGGDAFHYQSLPYTSVNVVEKTIDQPIKIDDFRSGANNFDDKGYFVR